MKKRLFLGLLAVTAVSFTACQKDEVISQMPKDQAIEFGTYLGRGAQTKGSVITTTELQTQGFGVYAYYTADADVTAGATISGTPNFMSNVKVYHSDWDSDNATPTTWGYTPAKYWPNTDGHKISFYAYGPYDANDDAITLAATSGTKPVLTYTVDADISKHMDVLFTPAQENLVKRNTAIEMPFYHALSKIGFKVNTAANYSSDNVGITITNVTLSGKYYTSAAMNLGTAGINVAGDPAVFSSVKDNWTDKVAPGSPVDFEYFTGTHAVTYAANAANAAELTGTNGYMMVIPQNFSSEQIKLSVSYNLTDAGSSVTANTVTKSINFNFEAGKAYTFLITIGGLQKVEFTADVIDWHDGGPDDSFTWN